jgi:hypothetical protein
MEGGNEQAFWGGLSSRQEQVVIAPEVFPCRDAGAT